MANDTIVKEIGQLEKLIHEPARLAILTALMNGEKADFIFLQNLVGLTKGNLSSHLTKLETGKLITIEKTYSGKKPVTYIMLTPLGIKSIVQYWEKLETIKQSL